MAVYTDTCTLGNLVNGRRIEIPPIQRDYAWKIKGKNPSALQLWSDLISFHFYGDADSSYYIGNMISWTDLNGETLPLNDTKLVWELLDGQQRLTSLTMIFNSIWIELNKEESEECQEICDEIWKKFLFADEEKFAKEIEETGVKSSLLPRREETRDFLIWLMTESNDLPSSYGNFNADVNMHLVALTYHLSVIKLLKEHGVDELIRFYHTMRDRVLVGVTVTDDLTMGFQMFQTANARGTALTSYDMFRAFSIKRAKVNLALSTKNVDTVVKNLNKVERKLLRFDEKKGDIKIEKETKSVMTAWTSCRTGRHHKDSQIVKTIEKDIDNLNSFAALKDVIGDLDLNARNWEGYKTRRPGSRYDADTVSWNIIGRFEELGFSLHWPLYLALRTAEEKLDWDEEVIENYLKVIEWSIVKTILAAGNALGGNTNPYQIGLPTDCHHIWNTYRGNDNELNAQVFNDRKQHWLVNHVNSNNPSGFALLTNAQFVDLKYIKVLLHLIDQNLGDVNPRGSGQQILVVKLFDPYEPNFGNLNLAESNQLGNYFLIRGSQLRGWTQNQAKEFSKVRDLGKKIRDVNRLSSQDPINSVSSISNPGQIRAFLRRRTEMIKQRLERGFQDALNSTLNL